MGSRGGIQALLARVPQRHWAQIGVGLKSRQMHLLAKTQACYGHAYRLKAHISC
jgi:hypothetical protein